MYVPYLFMKRTRTPPFAYEFHSCVVRCNCSVQPAARSLSLTVTDCPQYDILTTSCRRKAVGGLQQSSQIAIRHSQLTKGEANLTGCAH